MWGEWSPTINPYRRTPILTDEIRNWWNNNRIILIIILFCRRCLGCRRTDETIKIFNQFWQFCYGLNFPVGRNSPQHNPSIRTPILTDEIQSWINKPFAHEKFSFVFFLMFTEFKIINHKKKKKIIQLQAEKDTKRSDM